MIYIIIILFALFYLSIRSKWSRSRDQKQREIDWEQSAKEQLAWAKEQDEKHERWLQLPETIARMNAEEERVRNRNRPKSNIIHLHKHEHLHIDELHFHPPTE